MRVLVTAFKPFNKATNNYSIEVLNYINNVEKTIIDVIYDKCFYELEDKYDLNSYDLIIALGEARKRSEVTLEVQAVNKSSCSIPDNNGVYKVDEDIYKDGAPSLQTKVNVKQIKDLIVFSFDCGKYVCNNLYYHLLRNYPEKSLFIHIPNCYDDENICKAVGLKIEEIIKKLTESPS